MQNPFVFFVKSFVCVALLLFTSNLIAQKTKYKIDATLDSEERLIFVKQKIIFTNPDTEKLNVLFQTRGLEGLCTVSRTVNPNLLFAEE